MTNSYFLKSRLALTLLVALILPVVAQGQIALYDGPAGDTVDFTFGSFDTGLIETGSSLLIDVNDFGGCGLAIPLTEIPSTALLRVEYQVLPANDSLSFEVILRDNDGDDSAPGLGTEEFGYTFSTSGGTPLGDGFEEQTLNLNSFAFSQPALGFQNEGDGLLNLGLDQASVHSPFGSIANLNIEVRLVEIIITDSASLYNGCDGDTVDFTFDSFSSGLTETGTSLIIDVSAFGGLGVGFGQIDLDSDTAQLRVVYRALAGNEASLFQIFLQDNDGDDSAPGLGNEEFQYPFPFAAGTPLKDGSGFDEQLISLNDWVFRQQAFGFNNDGDMETNYGLVQFNLQSVFGSTDRTHMEVKSVEIVLSSDCLIGDVNLDGSVDLLDVTPFVTLLTTGEFQKEGDINEDGAVNLLDVTPLVELLSGG